MSEKELEVYLHNRSILKQSQVLAVIGIIAVTAAIIGSFRWNVVLQQLGVT